MSRRTDLRDEDDFEHTLTREELLAARARPPVRPEDVAAIPSRPQQGGQRYYLRRHGTRTGYKAGCRCDLCRDEENTYQRLRARARRRRGAVTQARAVKVAP